MCVCVGQTANDVSAKSRQRGAEGCMNYVHCLRHEISNLKIYFGFWWPRQMFTPSSLLSMSFLSMSIVVKRSHWRGRCKMWFQCFLKKLLVRTVQLNPVLDGSFRDSFRSSNRRRSRTLDSLNSCFASQVVKLKISPDLILCTLVGSFQCSKLSQ